VDVVFSSEVRLKDIQPMSKTL